MGRAVKTIALGVCLFSCLCTSGCSYKTHFETSPNNYGTHYYYDDERSYESRPHTMSVRSAADHSNRSITFSQSASDAVSGLHGVRQAFVFVSDKNAYAAVLLDHTAFGIKGIGPLEISDNTIGSNRFHQHTAQSRTLRPGVVVTEKYSYISARDNDGVSSNLRARAESVVLENHPNVQAVFISANPHFINELSAYAHAAWRGESLQPALHRFNGMVQSVFGPTRQLPH